MSILYSLFVLYMSILPKAPDFNLPEFDLKDKVLHAGAYVVLSLVLCFELYRQRFSFKEKTMYVWGALYPIVYGGIIEILQDKYFPPRTGEWVDWLADIIGVTVGFLLARYFYPKYVKPESQGIACR